MHVNYDLRSVTLTAGFVLSSESLKRFEFSGIRYNFADIITLVRYGISTYTKGGTVQIIVRDEIDCIEIEVKDDGSGGNKLTDAQQNRKSIGLENVRLRLRSSGMGELILSQDETGTSAIVRLKYKEV